VAAPVKLYPNSDTYKDQILSENKNKSGIYIFRNLINDKKYIGSSKNLSIRFNQYFNTNYLLNNTYMYIYRALLKHGYYNFSLTILEYCEAEQCLKREDFDLSSLNTEYNINH
jgi:group I intron endonuclease